MINRFYKHNLFIFHSIRVDNPKYFGGCGQQDHRISRHASSSGHHHASPRQEPEELLRIDGKLPRFFSHQSTYLILLLTNGYDSRQVEDYLLTKEIYVALLLHLGRDCG